jgi:hypothetical protein
LENAGRSNGKPKLNPDRYRLITVKMWDDDRFKSLSKPKPNGQSLWVYLLTGQHTTAFPGVFIAGEAALAEALDWPFPSFRRAFKEILDSGMANYDPKHRLVYLPKAVLHNPPQSPNVVIAWRKVYDLLPDCPLKYQLHQQTITNLECLGFGEAFTKAFGEAFKKGSAKPSPNQDSGTGNRNKIQEQDSGFPSSERSLKLSKPPVPEEANGRADESDRLKALEQSFSPIDAHIRKNVEEMSYLCFYAGMRPLNSNAHEVFVAVPGTLIQRNESSPEMTAKVLTATFNSVNHQFLRGRILRIVALDQESS